MSENKENERDRIYAERVAQARIVRKIVFVCLTLFLIVGAVAATSAYYYVNSAIGSFDEESEELIQVEIPIGSSSTQIGRILEEEGIIKSGTFFRYYVRYKSESGFQAGQYELSPAMTLEEIVTELKEGKVLQEPELVFTVPEGLWLENVIQIIARETDHDVEEIKEIISDRDYIQQLIGQFDVLTEDILEEGIRHPLEGYLFPARYDFLEEDVSIQTIIETMIKQTDSIVMPLVQSYPENEYSIHELLTLASIIEREAREDKDRYTISGVLYNRLEQNMMLQVDPTVAYAIGEHQYMTSYAHLEVDSPYNTYKYTGIPIGPIANPGEASIKAAFMPDDTDYLFFYARYNGEVIYTKTYAEHNQVHQQYRDEWIEAAEQAEKELEEMIEGETEED
ncbi:endolytic transglycosylase MltG [Alkalihalobacterium bogoriense]|uniref:endolytic transglycosylase MltG n=1 Tax=Alkalihalobacterium bogoriense TaxID=246272 RepID=UPI00047C3899|nr:endolytic transglycosylase MltG [Alkalihalobacterium bogoriense]